MSVVDRVQDPSKTYSRVSFHFQQLDMKRKKKRKKNDQRGCPLQSIKEEKKKFYVNLNLDTYLNEETKKRKRPMKVVDQTPSIGSSEEMTQSDPRFTTCPPT